MAKKSTNPPVGPRCSFCGRSVSDGVLVVPSENANICEDCAAAVNEFINEVHAKADALQDADDARAAAVRGRAPART